MQRIIQYIFTGLTIIFLLSCEGNFKDVQKMGFSEFSPSGEADNFNLKYTDSGRITSTLVSPKMKEYATVEYPFTEFPEGINATFFDKDGAKTNVVADYAVRFKSTDVIDLQGNVIITNETGQIMETPQLYFDQKNEWFYTEKKFKFTDPKGVSYGEGIDFSRDFKIVNSQRLTGNYNQSE